MLLFSFTPSQQCLPVLHYSGSGNFDSSLEPVPQPGRFFCGTVGRASPGFVEWPCRPQNRSYPPQPWSGPAGSRLPCSDVPQASCGLLSGGPAAQWSVGRLQRHPGGLFCLCGGHYWQEVPNLQGGGVGGLSGTCRDTSQHHRRGMAACPRVSNFLLKSKSKSLIS